MSSLITLDPFLRINPTLRSQMDSENISLSTSRRNSTRNRLIQNRIWTVKLWNSLQNDIKENSSLTFFLRNIREPVVIIDRLNQIPALGSLFIAFNDMIGYDVSRGSEYILSTGLQSVGCHRGTCRGKMGIQKLRFEDPLEFDFQKLDKETVFFDLATQAPGTTFIEIGREKDNSDEYYRIKSLQDNYAKISANESFTKEIDDMLTVALFFRLKELGKEVYIQSCDKYRWMNKIPLPKKFKEDVKRSQLMPYFLSQDMMDPPAIILMGFECAYDCTPKQSAPHNESCILKTEMRDPEYI